MPLASMAGKVVDSVYYSDEAWEKRQLLLDLREAIDNPSPNQKEYEPFTGYGRVIDQHGDPVVNARVNAHWDKIEIVSGYGLKLLVDKEWVFTDQNGYFSVTTPNGAIPILFGVKAKGYEEKWGLSPYVNSHGKNRESMMENSEAEPIILYMRKLNPTTFVLKNETGYYFKEATSHLRFTLNQGLLRKIDPDLSKLRTPEQNDLIFTVTKNEDNSFTMHIQPIPTIGGTMQILDDFLYKAPVAGYTQQATLTIHPGDGEIKKYLYFTSRNPAVYSRMTIDLHIRGNGDLSFDSITWTNPYGKHNLEWEPELPNKLRHILRKAGEKAIQTGTLAVEPVDLSKLIEQYATE